MSITEQLETMIDQHGLLHVVTGLELVCAEKAEHIKTNWQDKSTARAWNACAATLSRCAQTISRRSL